MNEFDGRFENAYKAMFFVRNILLKDIDRNTYWLAFSKEKNDYNIILKISDLKLLNKIQFDLVKVLYGLSIKIQ